jgi:hypothetical protein
LYKLLLDSDALPLKSRKFLCIFLCMSVFFVLKEERMKKLGKILLAGVFAVASLGILSCSSGGGGRLG